MRPTLTTEGRKYAERTAAESIVARVALRGYDGEWPEEFVTAGINACNEKGAKELPEKKVEHVWDLPVFGWAWKGDALDVER